MDFATDRSVISVSPQGKVSHLPRPGWWRKATCKDVDCVNYLYGWRSYVPVASVDILADMRRCRIWEFAERRLDDHIIEFSFPPGQTCYKHLDGVGHLVPVERDPVFIQRSLGRQRLVDYDEWHTNFNEAIYQTRKVLQEV